MIKYNYFVSKGKHTWGREKKIIKYLNIIFSLSFSGKTFTNRSEKSMTTRISLTF